jgi:hypothetical protein
MRNIPTSVHELDINNIDLTLKNLGKIWLTGNLPE